MIDSLESMDKKASPFIEVHQLTKYDKFLEKENAELIWMSH